MNAWNVEFNKDKAITLSLRSAFFCSNSSMAFVLRASRALSSCSLKGQFLGIPGSFSTLFFPPSLSFFASFVFFLLCSFTFRITLYFFFNETLLLLLSSTQKIHNNNKKNKQLKSLHATDIKQRTGIGFSYSCSSSPFCVLYLHKRKRDENDNPRQK